MCAEKSMFRHTFRHCPVLKYRLSKFREITAAITPAPISRMKPVITTRLKLLQSTTTIHNLKARVRLFTTRSP
jgi:hypothetical protein